MRSRHPDSAPLREALGVLCEPGEMYELRVLDGDGKAPRAAGFFTNAHALASAATRHDGKAAGVYVTLNPVKAGVPTQNGHPVNRVSAKVSGLTKDVDVLRRRWLLLDFDPVRHPTAISATDAEKAAAN